MSFLLPSCEEIPPESLLASDTISSPKSDMPASEPFISKGTVEHTSNCEFLLKIYHFPSFWKLLSSTKLTCTPTLSAIYALTPYRIEVSLKRTSRKNTLPFVCQSINNFSDYDISQSVDWECPSLSPHVLLVWIELRARSYLEMPIVEEEDELNARLLLRLKAITNTHEKSDSVNICESYSKCINNGRKF